MLHSHELMLPVVLVFVQGKTFWTRYLQVFRSYVVRYSVLGDLPCELMHLVHVLDYAFDVIEKNYIEGRQHSFFDV